MGYFYFARHGQTVWNVENKICGATDIELTAKGHRQAEKLGEKYWKKGSVSMRSSALRWRVRQRLQDISLRSPEFPCVWNRA